ncbi:MAG: nucleotidyltransferase family protein [Deltaproteobacteria bacterium]|nr:nucleotidyltransferase family protein [Deltaproteobacteria bacterium]
MNPSQKKISGIILAAGSGSRMGKTKQILPFASTTLLGRVIQNARESALYEIIVVLGHDAKKICKVVNFSGTKIVRNKEYKKGQSTSLIAGLENVSPLCSAAMFILADQPFVTAAIINKLIDALKTPEDRIAVPYCSGRRGNPVIIGNTFFGRIKSLSADTGARVLFDEFKEAVLKVTIQDNAILIDVDTMDDYKKLILKTQGV